MNIAELIKHAFETRDWGEIAVAYERLTGESVFDDEEQEVRPSPRPPLLKKDNRGEESLVAEENENKRMAIAEQVKISKNRVNLFNDDGSECVADKAIDKVLCKTPPMNVRKGGARKGELVSVTCRICNKKSIVNRGILGGKYVCDKCISGRTKQAQY